MRRRCGVGLSHGGLRFGRKAGVVLCKDQVGLRLHSRFSWGFRQRRSSQGNCRICLLRAGILRDVYGSLALRILMCCGLALWLLVLRAGVKSRMRLGLVYLRLVERRGRNLGCGFSCRKVGGSGRDRIWRIGDGGIDVCHRRSWYVRGRYRCPWLWRIQFHVHLFGCVCCLVCCRGRCLVRIWGRRRAYWSGRRRRGCGLVASESIGQGLGCLRIRRRRSGLCLSLLFTLLLFQGTWHRGLHRRLYRGGLRSCIGWGNGRNVCFNRF